MDGSSEASDTFRTRWQRARPVSTLGLTLLLAVSGAAVATGASEPSPETSCGGCHDSAGAKADQLAGSVHAGFDCVTCHPDREQVPHPEDITSNPGSDPCRTCHDDVAQAYTEHGMVEVGSSKDIPDCADCHGSHDVLAPDNAKSSVHPDHLETTCGRCHRNLDVIRKHHLEGDSIDVYARSVHGGGADGPRASCIDCHGTDRSGHRLLAPAEPESSINRLNIPATCGHCHASEEKRYREGIHGQLTARGETDAPVCTGCHGEHGILPPSDPDSPVSPTKVAEETCARCHDSAILNQRYGLPAGRLTSYIDSYHGLKSRAGDTKVANCASCHGAHRVLPESDPRSRVNPKNVQKTCGTCHPGITEQLATTPIHSTTGEGLTTSAGRLVEHIYIVAIIVIIGLMVVHWLFDLARHLGDLFRARPRVRRMRWHEVLQHALLAVSFVVLAVTGFALVYDGSWFAELFFGFRGGFDLRGVIHRVAAVVFVITILWHCTFVAITRRGRGFCRDMLPQKSDFRHFGERIAYNLRLRSSRPREGRFTYVEKAEYWALVWGGVVMAASGTLLWFDDFFSTFLPQSVLDVARAMHYWEAWLATLAILVWHLYATVFNPEVYPMNPSWLTGTMPEGMYRREHPAVADEAEMVDETQGVEPDADDAPEASGESDADGAGRGGRDGDGSS